MVLGVGFYGLGLRVWGCRFLEFRVNEFRVEGVGF